MRTSELNLSFIHTTEAEGVGKTLESASRLGGFGFTPLSSGDTTCGDDMTKLRVLLADDHEGFRRILSSFLRSQIGVEVVGEAADGQDAVDLTLRLRPDLVFIDLHMPTYDGIEATKAIKGKLPGTRVFVLSMDSSEYHRQAVDRADGFITKQTMKNAIMTVLANERLRGSRITNLAS
jgi:DNA-binding NarL/FixJ family response regulator